MSSKKKGNIKQIKAIVSKSVKNQQISGSGDYKAVARSILSGLKSKQFGDALAVGGKALGNYALPGSGDILSKFIKSIHNKISGNGDYTVQSDVTCNSLFKNTRNMSPNMSFADMANGTRVQHRELIKMIAVQASNGTFSIQPFVVNPGAPDTFPYLSNLARLYEEYKFMGLVFEFVSTTSPYNPTPAMGSVFMAAEYNVTQTPYINAIEMLNSDFAISSRPDGSMLYGIECLGQAQNQYYVSNDTNTLTPANLKDFAILYFGTQLGTNYTVGQELGQLWVTYDVILSKPFFQSPLYGNAVYYSTIQAKTIVPSEIFTTPAMIANTGRLDSDTKPNWETREEIADGEVRYVLRLSFSKLQVGDIISVNASFFGNNPITTELVNYPQLSCGYDGFQPTFTKIGGSFFAQEHFSGSSYILDAVGSGFTVVENFTTTRANLPYLDFRLYFPDNPEDETKPNCAGYAFTLTVAVIGHNISPLKSYTPTIVH